MGAKRLSKIEQNFGCDFGGEKGARDAPLEVGLAECAGSLGGIIGGYKDAKIAGETRTRALGIPVVYLARRPWWGGGSLSAFRRAEVIFCARLVTS